MDGQKPNTPSKDFEKMAPYWKKVEAITSGRDAMIEAGEEYLPKFPHEEQGDYDFRLKTAKFTNIYRDILEGLSSKPFAHELVMAEGADARLEEFARDVDGRGNSLHVFAGDVFFNGINKAVDWILVEYTPAEGVRTIEDERREGVRPYWVHVPADTVLEVRSEVLQGREQLIHVRILERKNRVREYNREGSTVTWKMWEKDEEGEWLVADEGTLSLGVIPMVPFITGRRRGTKWVFHPPMEDAADLQVEHYQADTELKYIKTMTAFPMLAGNGVDPKAFGEDGPKVPVGPKAVLFAPPNAEGKHGAWEWIGTDAASLRFLAEEVDAIAKELRELGRQPLTAQSGNLTVITTAVAAAKANSAVQAWALGLKDALENALKLTAAWMGRTVTDDAVAVSVFTDFGVEDADDGAPDHLIKLLELGEISTETVWQEFKRRGILGPEFDSEEELEALLGGEDEQTDIPPEANEAEAEPEA